MNFKAFSKVLFGRTVNFLAIIDYSVFKVGILADLPSILNRKAYIV